MKTMIGRLRLVFWTGIALTFLPFFGIPNTWKTGLAIAIGIGLIVLSIALRKKYRALRLIIRNLERTVAEQTVRTPHHDPHA
jgi:hypothetical protein